MSASAILLLEPDPTFADLIRATLEGAGHPVTVVDDPEEAIKLAGDHALLMVDVADAGGARWHRGPAPPTVRAGASD